MNLRFFGDAHDHWKGSLLRRMTAEKLLVELKVDLMATDAANWKERDLSLFGNLLGVLDSQFVQHQHSLIGKRRAYFGELGNITGDLFLDPDTGIATSPVKEPENYLFPGELHRLLEKVERVVAVYQHISRQTPRDRVMKVVEVIRMNDKTIACCSYESASVAMLFFSTSPYRVKSIKGYFDKLLGRHAKSRVYSLGIEPVGC